MRPMPARTTDPIVVATARSSTRRALLKGTARVAGGGAFAVALGGLVARPGFAAARAGSDLGFAGDLDVLHYLLDLERAQAALYADFRERFTRDESGDRYLPTNPTLIRALQQERGHVALLEGAIAARGGTPAPAASYDFGYEGVAGFLEVAAGLEEVGVAAYAGAVPALADADLLAAALGVLAVEARHAAYLNGALGRSPFPAGTTPVLAPAEVAGFTGQYVRAVPGRRAVTPLLPRPVED